MPVMAVAAFIASILALGAVVFSAWYARDVACTERDRRLEERAPKITPRLHQSADPGRPWVLELLLGHGTRSGQLAEVSTTMTRITDGNGNTYSASDMYLGCGRPGSHVRTRAERRHRAQGVRPHARGAVGDG